ncbi:phage tail protein [Acinetobacter baumannii]|uniref:phage tail fiber protein n=1 Tax=Acinetobacter baumannii TaxID=470 RepID=UPI0038B44CC0
MANLVFKFSWDHRPFPYNSAQGKRQFMLPFASGIPNLTPDWRQVTGLGNAATATLTTSSQDNTAGRVLKVGDGGLLSPIPLYDGIDLNSTQFHVNATWYTTTATTNGWANGIIQTYKGNSTRFAQLGFLDSGELRVRGGLNIANGATWQTVRTTGNTTVDANGFVKSASPIVKLFNSHIELNDDAAKQPLNFEKLDIGDYLLTGSLGFAQEGWYIEVPKDANGNTVVAVEYSTLENGDISIKTYKRKFDVEKAAIVADLENPFDIPEGRWIDIRLHEEPEPEPEEPLSETPAEFQPTNLSQAVAAAMNGVEPPEISDTNEKL